VTVILTVFAASLLGLYLLDLTGWLSLFFRRYRHYAIFQIALCLATAVSYDDMIGTFPREWAYAPFLAAGVVSFIWAGILGLKEEGS
jgi:hypothetical protein